MEAKEKCTYNAVSYPNIVHLVTPHQSRRGRAGPGKSYVDLIFEAISSSPRHQMVLGDIYEYLTKTYDYFRRADKGWKVQS